MFVLHASLSVACLVCEGDELEVNTIGSINKRTIESFGSITSSAQH